MKNQQPGYIALIATIVIFSLLTAIAVTLSMTSFFVRSTLLESEYKERSIALAEACADTALLKRAANPAYVGNEIIPVNPASCTILPIITGPPLPPGEIGIKTKAIFQNAVTNMCVVANDTDLAIISWREVETPVFCP